MPATRRSSGSNRSAAASGKQSTLSFNQRVTKSVPKSTAKDLQSSTPTKQSPLAKHVATLVDDAVEVPEPETVEEPKEEETSIVKEDEEEVEAKVPEKSEAELKAEKITDRQVDQYWRKLESKRIAKRVHQEDLSVSEKVLRYFDVSSQYGVCSFDLDFQHFSSDPLAPSLSLQRQTSRLPIPKTNYMTALHRCHTPQALAACRSSWLEPSPGSSCRAYERGQERHQACAGSAYG